MDFSQVRAVNDAVVRNVSQPVVPPTSADLGTSGLDAVHASGDGQDQGR
jgi:hypothetical protein